jgi:hypothetical protein
VTENTNYISLLNNIKSRNHDSAFKPMDMPQTNIVKITYSKKLTYKNPNIEVKKTEKPGLNICTTNDTIHKVNSSNSKSKRLHAEKASPVVLIPKNK